MSTYSPTKFDVAAYYSFTVYAISSLVVPLLLIEIGRSLDFPLDKGGMSSGGLLHVCRSFTMLLSLLSCSWFASRLGKRRSMCLAMCVMGTGMLLCSFSTSFRLMSCFILLAGIGEGICEGIATPFVNDLHPKDPSSYVSIAHSFWSVGTIAAVVTAGCVSHYGGSWRLTLFLTGIATFLSAASLLLMNRFGTPYPEQPLVRHGESAGTRRKSWEIFCSMRFWKYCLCMGVGAGAEFGLTFWSSSFIRMNFNENIWAGALGTAAIGLGMFAGRMVLGRYVPSHHLRGLLLWSSGLGIPASLLLLVIKPDLCGSHTQLTMVLLYLLLVVNGICVASFWPSLQVYGVLQLPRLDSTLLYVYYSAVGIPGCGFFTWLMGYIGDHGGLRAAFLTAPVSMLIYFLILLTDKARNRP